MILSSKFSRETLNALSLNLFSVMIHFKEICLHDSTISSILCYYKALHWRHIIWKNKHNQYQIPKSDYLNFTASEVQFFRVGNSINPCWKKRRISFWILLLFRPAKSSSSYKYFFVQKFKSLQTTLLTRRDWNFYYILSKV